MAQIEQNNIIFNSVKDKGGVTVGTGPIRINGQNSFGENSKDIVNAVDIDWNGAQVEENVTLNSTGDLLSWIKIKGGNRGGTIL